jgi:cytochrome c-type biogenesis protein CcmH/NrfF
MHAAFWQQHYIMSAPARQARQLPQQLQCRHCTPGSPQDSNPTQLT